jgi:HNH endonuclease
VRLYWPQAAPFVATREPAGASRAAEAEPGYGTTAAGACVLQQNTGRQASILRQIEAARRRYGGSLAALERDSRAWRALVRETAKVVRTMPLGKLQRVGREPLEFLYHPGAGSTHVTLLPGVAYCLRRFHPLVRDMVHGAWVRFVRSLPANRRLLGDSHDLQEFLFGSARVNLERYREPLREIQQDRCFYCAGSLREKVEVDHFIPWARYPLDLGHNFVLAHPRCNADKSDRLAALPHLEHWCERNERHGAVLAAGFDARTLVHDLPASLRITRWAYEQAELASAQVWVESRDVLEPLTPAWRALPGLAAAYAST